MSIGVNDIPDNQQANPAPIEDPLIAALPPKTDYITYLTILEYNLKPQNISTLNRLLQEDDGTLASEIGWDLLKIVLPFLKAEPEKARECLDIIARRGNPREVIVRIAEELEKLGQDESDGEADPQNHADGLPTFVGEAPRVHLGEMKLAGMPEVLLQKIDSETEEQNPETAIDETKLLSLLAMLAVLHPRIRTQHPSRFLATSLPAALAAYRRLTLNSESTIVFLNTLLKLVYQKRPPLPPRVSTNEVLKQIPTDLKPVASRLEENVEDEKPAEEMAENEKAINLRLVQAVFFEILEEYTAASSEAQPPLTTHLRSIFEPQSLISPRTAELEKLVASTEGQSARSLRLKFVSTATDLKVNIKDEIMSLDKPKRKQEGAEAESEEEHEYPTSPSQIAFSNTGLLLLRCAQVYLLAAKEQKPLNPPVNLQHIMPTILRSLKNDARFKTSPPAIDSLLAMFYMGICAQAPPPPNAPFTSQEQIQPTLLKTFDILREIFTYCHDADLRDNAHHIATNLLHGHANRETRLKIVRSLLETPPTSATSSLSFGAQPGNLKAIAVDWLKSELYPTEAVKAIMAKNRPDFEAGLPVASTLASFADLLFPATAANNPPSRSASSEDRITDADQQAIDDFATNIPFYISSLNFLTLSLSHEKKPESTAEPNSATTTPPKAETVATTTDFIAHLDAWTKYLNGEIAVATESRSPSPAGSVGSTSSSASKKRKRNGLEHLEAVERTDLFALEDALERVKALL